MRTPTQRDDEQKPRVRHQPTAAMPPSAAARRARRRWLRNVADTLVGATGT